MFVKLKEKIVNNKLKFCVSLLAFTIIISGIVVTINNTGNTYASDSICQDGWYLASTTYNRCCPTGWTYGSTNDRCWGDFTDLFTSSNCTAMGGELSTDGNRCFINAKAPIDSTVSYSVKVIDNSGSALQECSDWTVSDSGYDYCADYSSGSSSISFTVKDTKLDLGDEYYFRVGSRSGYTLAGFATSEGGDVVYSPSSRITLSGSLTLYAVWNANSYTLTLKNSGDGMYKCTAISGDNCAYYATTSTDTVTISDVTAGSYKLNTNKYAKFEREGYTFAGWATTAGGSVKYSANSTLQITKDTTLWAVWTEAAIEPYTLTLKDEYDALYACNEHQNGDPYCYEVDTSPSESVHITVSLPATSTERTYTFANANGTGYDYHVERPGWKFLGWSAANDNTPDYSPTATITLTGDRTLYTCWGEGSYTVSFDANGGSGAPASQTKKHDEALILTTDEPTRSGYTFLGWDTNKDATTATYTAGGRYVNNSNAVLYAIWKKKDSGSSSGGGGSTTTTTYTITYDANGGTGAPASQTKTKDVNLVLSSTVPTYTGYTFLGWDTNKDATTATYTAGATYTNNASVKLYAIWKQDDGSVNKYTITYDANGGSNAPASQSKTHGVNVALSTQIPTRDGYTFLGWNTDKNAKTALYKSGAVYSADENVTLYAIWEENSKEDEDIKDNIPTGDILIGFAWLIGLGALGYSVYYFRTRKMDI